MIHRFSRRFARVACECIVPLSVSAAGALTESAAPSVTSLLQACEETVLQECSPLWVIVECSKYVRFTVALARHGSCKTLYTALRARGMMDYYILLNGWPVSESTLVSDLGITHNAVFTANRRLRGGSSDTSGSFSLTNSTPKFSGDVVGEWRDVFTKGQILDSCISQRYTKKVRQRTRTYELQAFESELDPLKDLKKFIDPETMGLVEDLTILGLQIFRSSSSLDRILAVTCFVKSQSRGSLIFSSATLVADIVSDLVGPELQSADEVLEGVTDFRDLMSKWQSLTSSSLVQRFLKAYKFAVAAGVFRLVGIELTPEVVSACKREAGVAFSGPNFVFSLLDAISLLIQRALMFVKTGDWQTLFHGPKSYGEWFDLCQAVKRQSNFLGNLDAVGTNYHTFVSDVDRSIEMGESILKFGEKTTGIEAKSIKTLLGEVKMIRANLFTYDEAQKSRRPPFALLVHSNSSMAKSTFVDMLFKFMGQVWELEATDAFKYTRQSTDQFWSGWNSSKWFILLDDIAYINPNSPVQDVSLTEMIALINDVPLVPNQASLEDKGKNPVRARAVVATTNVKHLNAQAHFACPLAVQRRLPFVVNLTPKPEFARDDSPGMIDPTKLTPIVDDWPDFWNITVERVVDAGGGFARHQLEEQFDDINDFLDWLRIAMTIFDDVQSRAASGCAAMANFKVCADCNRVRCTCVQVQCGRARQLPEGVRMGDSFTIVDTEDGTTYHECFEPHDSGEANYICTQITLRGSKVLFQRVVPVTVSDRAIPETRLDSRAEYAQVLAEIVRLQAQKTRRSFQKGITYVVSACVEVYSRSRFWRRVVDYALDWAPCRAFFIWIVNKLLLSRARQRDWCIKLGELAYKAYMTPRWKLAVAGLSAACGLVLVVKGYQAWNKRTTKTAQSLRSPAPSASFVIDEKENVWKRDDFEICAFDRTPLNVNYKQLPFDQLVGLIRRNVARIKVSNGDRAREGNALCVGGHLWVTNNHTFFSGGDLEVTLATQPDVVGISPNVTFKVRQSALYRVGANDLVFFEVLCMSPKRDLRDLVRKPTLSFRGKGFYVGYDKLRSPQTIRVSALCPGQTYVQEFDLVLPAWSGSTDRPTVYGDCGMPLVSYGEPVVAIVGLHMLGNPACGVWATELDSSIVAEAEAYFGRPVIQCGLPELSSVSVRKELGALHQRSPLRWVAQGSASVYGSFLDRPFGSRSKVRKTLLGDVILAERGWNVDAHAPKLLDWRPWNHALNDIMGQQHGAIDPVKLRLCSKSFVRDILAQLPEGALTHVQVLDDRATINGIPGVKFIDKMNFKSSMGEPYRKAKKFFLAGEIGEVEFNDEIKARIAKILGSYESGTRAHPVYCGQCKDEARAWIKVVDGKVRVFTMAPADWSFCVRKFLLTTVKLIQDHPFVFNASPGCAAQSAEWEQYYDYLTQFGPDRLVAGDYGKFDKKMEASVILEAFHVIAEIMRAAGWSEEDLKPVYGIAEDTAFSLVNFNGDLVEFVGSNPSGHPLTVIVNCIVNVLYMRYCYMELNPADVSAEEKLATFKENVALLTYGDDNTMNVSLDCDWFNHTAIQGVLAGIGVEYTMADKHSVSRPFIHIREVSYLKRKWRWDEDIGAVVCPLEEASIHKMLTVCLPSEEESREFHMASVMVSAANEWFWYGKEKFECERQWLEKMAADHGIQRELEIKHLPTWDELVERYWDASKGLETARSKGCLGVHPRDVVA